MSLLSQDDLRKRGNYIGPVDSSCTNIYIYIYIEERDAVLKHSDVSCTRILIRPLKDHPTGQDKLSTKFFKCRGRPDDGGGAAPLDLQLIITATTAASAARSVSTADVVAANVDALLGLVSPGGDGEICAILNEIRVKNRERAENKEALRCVQTMAVELVGVIVGRFGDLGGGKVIFNLILWCWSGRMGFSIVGNDFVQEYWQMSDGRFINDHSWLQNGFSNSGCSHRVAQAGTQR